MRLSAIFGFLFLIMSSAHADQQAFARTEPGVVEIKTLPAGRLLESRGDGDYFNQSNSLFRPLFRYISQHDISMTTPVEARIEPGMMYFWVSPDQVGKATEDSDEVRVIDIPERTVAAIGARGGYSQSNFEEAKVKLLQWIEEQDNLEVTGEPFAVYWNGPFTPWFRKVFEVQVTIRESK
jgi:effector-binding domain-containing protein